MDIKKLWYSNNQLYFNIKGRLRKYLIMIRKKMIIYVIYILIELYLWYSKFIAFQI